MKTFTDNAGRSWSVTINVAVLARVRDEAGVDLIRAFEPESGILERLADPVTLCAAVYAACRPQAEKLALTPEQFGESMAGDAIESAAAALLDELVDFFPSRRRAILRQIVDKMKQADELILASAKEALESGQFDAALEAAMRAASGGRSGSSPASSESPTPVP